MSDTCTWFSVSGGWQIGQIVHKWVFLCIYFDFRPLYAKRQLAAPNFWRTSSPQHWWCNLAVALAIGIGIGSVLVYPCTYTCTTVVCISVGIWHLALAFWAQHTSTRVRTCVPVLENDCSQGCPWAKSNNFPGCRMPHMLLYGAFPVQSHRFLHQISFHTRETEQGKNAKLASSGDVEHKRTCQYTCTHSGTCYWNQSTLDRRVSKRLVVSVGPTNTQTSCVPSLNSTDKCTKQLAYHFDWNSFVNAIDLRFTPQQWQWHKVRYFADDLAEGFHTMVVSTRSIAPSRTSWQGGRRDWDTAISRTSGTK